MIDYIIQNFSVGTWYQNLFMYALLAGLAYANIVLIKKGEKKKAEA